jgi:hypothetical protein
LAFVAAAETLAVAVVVGVAEGMVAMKKTEEKEKPER